jgi:hypothetical protein
MKALRVALALIAIALGILSLYALAAWLFITTAIIVGGGGLGSLASIHSNHVPSIGATPLFVLQTVNYFIVLGGAFGWVALFALCTQASRPLRYLSKWVVVGCAVGALAALAVPVGRLHALFPIGLAAVLLLRCWLAVPNYSFQRTR